MESRRTMSSDCNFFFEKFSTYLAYVLFFLYLCSDYDSIKCEYK